MVDLIDFAKKNFVKKLPFVIYSKPNQDKIVGIFQEDEKVYSSEDLEEVGFVLAPFEGKEPILIPENKSVIKVVDFIFNGNSSTTNVVLDSTKGKDAFENLVQRGKDAIENNLFEKVVLSRKEIITVQDFDFTVIFERLLQTYPTAFKYCWFHPKIGMWMGATPEQLLKTEDNIIKTVALAGTQKQEESQEISWGEKEIEEQKFVTDFIVDHFQKLLQKQ